ncbi:MAG: glycerol-3-phosphate cytidylyltransferase [Patescibacteria group bacterium]|nr:MAG: glycerol-3-phosphate cytidylyltransferase [Patescibacteria group bacterium]
MILDYKNCGSVLKNIKKTKALIGGCFDIIHYGHLDFIIQAAKIAEILIVALEPDESIIKKNRQPVHNQQQRAEILDSLRFVDYVVKLPVLNGFNQYLEMIKKIRPNYIVANQKDTKLKNKRLQSELVKAEFITIDYKFKYSSSAIINS